jgi:hypothetical protein
MIVVGHNRCVDGEMLQQALAVSGILCGDNVYRLQYIDCPL